MPKHYKESTNLINHRCGSFVILEHNHHIHVGVIENSKQQLTLLLTLEYGNQTVAEKIKVLSLTSAKHVHIQYDMPVLLDKIS